MDFEDAFFDTSDFTLGDSLGKGSFGEVFIAERKSDKEKFAVKILSDKEESAQGMNGQDQQKFLLEAQIIHKLNHPAVVKFHGINFHSFDDSSKFEPAILTQYISKGSLLEMIIQEKNQKADPQWNSTKKYICLLGIAHAMNYLHKNRIIHHDLKPANVLLDGNFYPYVCDFGISKCIPSHISKHVQDTCENINGTYKYMAPELKKINVIYGASIDVYAFAITAYQLYTGEFPGKKPKYDKTSINKKLEELIERCRSDEPYKRPSFAEIFYILSNDFDYSKPRQIDDDDDDSKDDFNEEEVRKYIEYIEGSIQRKDTNSNNKLTNLLLNVNDFVYDKNQKGKHGGVSTIYEATFKNKKYSLKVMHLQTQQEIQSNFIKPIEIQSSLDHPSILKLIGFTIPSIYENKPEISHDYFTIVTEFPTNGSLYDYLNKIREGQFQENWPTIRAKIIFGIAAGMAFIHQNNIVLADLRSKSVFLDDELNPKIGGFVNAIKLMKGSSSHSREARKGIGFYMAPELFESVDYLPYNHKVDVYAFGMVLFQIFSTEDEIRNLYQNVVGEKKKPEIEGNSMINDEFKNLINLCWNADPDNRPSFLDIILMLINQKNAFFQNIDFAVFDEYANTVKKDLAYW